MISNDMNLEQLFQEADRIGNKYQTAEERAAFEQEIADIAKETWDDDSYLDDPRIQQCEVESFLSMDLEELFQEADRIGNKYQSAEDDM